MNILFIMHPNKALNYDVQDFIARFIEGDFKVYLLSSFIGHKGVDRNILPETRNFKVITFPNLYIKTLDRFTAYKVLRNLLVQTLMLIKTVHITLRYNINAYITLGGFVESGIAPLICSKTLKKPLTVRVISDPSRDISIRLKSPLIYKIYKKAEKEILKHANRIIVLDNADLEKYKNAKVIPQKVNTKIFKRRAIKREQYEKYKLSTSDFLLLYAGRITQEKGVKTLVESFPQILEKTPNAKLLLVGRGDLENYVKRFTQTHSLEEKIHLLGEKTQKELCKLYNMANTTILLSKVEATPNVILESLACNTPVIATKTGNIPVIIAEGKNGFLVDPKPEEISNAVAKIRELKKGEYAKIVKERNKRYEEGMKTLIKELSAPR